MPFATGSSELSEDDRAQIVDLVSRIPAGDLALVIGYASETGDAANNERLSSDRATSVAQFFADMKDEEQSVQAVYLGQTDRFSSSVPERNQLCEIWHIRSE